MPITVIPILQPINVELLAKAVIRTSEIQVASANADGEYQLDSTQAARMACDELRIDNRLCQLIGIAMYWSNDVLEWAENPDESKDWPLKYQTPKTDEPITANDHD